MAFFGTSVASDETGIVVHNRHKNRNNRPRTILIRAAVLFLAPENRPRSGPGRSKHRQAWHPAVHRQTIKRSWRFFRPRPATRKVPLVPLLLTGRQVAPDPPPPRPPSWRSRSD